MKKLHIDFPAKANYTSAFAGFLIIYVIMIFPIILISFKKSIYNEPYKNKPEIKNDELFVMTDSKELKYNITLKSSEDIYNLFTMTPYYYKTSKEDLGKLLKLETLTTTVHFAIEIYKKVGKLNV